MRAVISTAFVAVLSLAARAEKPLSTDKPIQLALMCFKKGEEVSGINKICFYDCGGSAAAITVSVAQVCPLSINR